MRKRINLSNGDTAGFSAGASRKMELIGTGRTAYLWIGNETPPFFCYATLSGPRTLRKFAQLILDVVPEPKQRRKK